MSIQVKCPYCDSKGINYITDDSCKYCRGTSKIDGCDLRKRLVAAFPYLTEADFDRHDSDLYVVDETGDIRKWLKENYEHYTNVQSFVGVKGSPWQFKRCLDIPFAAMAEHRPDLVRA